MQKLDRKNLIIGSIWEIEKESDKDFYSNHMLRHEFWTKRMKDDEFIEYNDKLIQHIVNKNPFPGIDFMRLIKSCG